MENKNYELGYKCYHNREYDKAYSYFLLAANENYGLAYLSLATLFHRGRGVEKDLNQAYFYYLKASEYNINEAYYFLGEFFEKGYVDNIDYNRAFHYYKLAADSNHIKAMFKVGKMLFEGDNIPQDRVSGINYLVEAAKNGSDNAKKYIKNI